MEADQNLRECPVCLNLTAGTVSPCGHPLCDACSQQWRAKANTCPYCRAEIVDVDERKRNGSNRTVWLTFPAGTHAGVTLRRFANGVLVLHLEVRDRAYICGLRTGDVIVSIDGFVATTPSVVVQIIHAATSARRVCTLEVIRRCRLVRSIAVCLLAI